MPQDIKQQESETNHMEQHSLQCRQQQLIVCSAVVRGCYQLEMDSFLHPSLMNMAILCLCVSVLVGPCTVFVQMPVVSSLNHESIH